VTQATLRRTPARGFASMDRERQREIASKGGRAAHAKGTAHEWSVEEARAAGRKGGEIVSRDRDHMAAIGRDGGGARSANARSRRPDDEAADERVMDLADGRPGEATEDMHAGSRSNGTDSGSASAQP
jgi:general stress protein YciG